MCCAVSSMSLAEAKISLVFALVAAALASFLSAMISWPTHISKIPRSGVHSSTVILKACDVPPPTDGLPTSSCVMPCSASSGMLLLSHGLLSIYSRKPRTTGMPLGAVSVAPSSFHPAGTASTTSTCHRQLYVQEAECQAVARDRAA